MAPNKGKKVAVAKAACSKRKATALAGLEGAPESSADAYGRTSSTTSKVTGALPVPINMEAGPNAHGEAHEQAAGQAAGPSSKRQRQETSDSDGAVAGPSNASNVEATSNASNVETSLSELNDYAKINHESIEAVVGGFNGMTDCLRTLRRDVQDIAETTEGLQRVVRSIHREGHDCNVNLDGLATHDDLDNLLSHDDIDPNTLITTEELDPETLVTSDELSEVKDVVDEIQLHTATIDDNVRGLWVKISDVQEQHAVQGQLADARYESFAGLFEQLEDLICIPLQAQQRRYR
ncbi:hypothetical protein LTR85_007249 [Meristemomyces frigidus]|nr:hypothetical protein LTR85_007249 [Meristemomyces frigidus]